MMEEDNEDQDDSSYDDNFDHDHGNGSYGTQNNDDDSEVVVVEDEPKRKRGRPSKKIPGQAPERRPNPNLCTDDCVAVNYEQQRRHRMNQSNLRAAKNREIAQLRAQALEYLARLDKCACGHT